VEQATEPGRCIRENLQTTGLAERGTLHPVAVTAFLRPAANNLTINADWAHNKDRYDIIFCDPPYADPAIPETLAQIAAWPGLSAEGLLVVGHAIQVELPDRLGPLERVRFRKFGGSAFSLYKHAAVNGPVAPDLKEED
jgi:16S rRNA G966 N2-methylase RsmD